MSFFDSSINKKYKEYIERLNQKISNKNIQYHDEITKLNSSIIKQTGIINTLKLCSGEVNIEECINIIISSLTSTPKADIDNSQITILNNNIQFLQYYIATLLLQNNKQLENNKRLLSMVTDEHYQLLDIKEQLQILNKQKAMLELIIVIKLIYLIKLNKRIEPLDRTVNYMNNKIIELKDDILYQEFGLYEPIYNLRNSDDYKQKINECRQRQKKMIKSGTAISCNITWTVNSSIRQGEHWVKQFMKEAIRSFNTESEGLILKVKFNNYESIKKRIEQSYNLINQFNNSSSIFISQNYLNEKINELNLCYEYEQKKQDEKDERRILREQQLEEAKVQKEIATRRAEIVKEQKHYSNQLVQIDNRIHNTVSIEEQTILSNKRSEIDNQLQELEKALKDVDYREANKRAGYVYIISNIGAFGNNIYKIGMTRRLDPQERIDELGGASVPFKFDIHAMIFSDDAPTLEAKLHQAFSDRKVNMINNRKEFFHVTLEEIETEVKKNHDKSIEFIRNPEAEQYRETLMLYKRVTK
ncbi:DUF4041 domain-containing protein [Caproiciproducens sp. CPB-2]|uniref:DUF4041 domain-containing protein n=1 Tax=Caproiciproducens sp. CPB-2 TaxID=3030017 RepID=UPI0023D9B4BB|nr:DUF4041 domain-containing protein [Caproiciproducens sp. CPB-2]MDF1496309.1 DUF4041 domain-containing protein [Caproiciproducens sp. CPB-2]